MWLSLSMACFLAAVYSWQLGDKWAAQKTQGQPEHGTNQVQPPERSTKPAASAQTRAAFPLLSQAGLLNAIPAHSQARTNRVSPLAYRLTNTKLPLRKLMHSEAAILLGNALLDTANPDRPAIPDALKSRGDPGSYIIQSRGPLDNSFRALLKAAGATVVSYVPNNAYLVRASADTAQQVEANPQTQAVLPYEPYYKLKASLLQLAVEEQPLPDQALLNVLVFPDAHQAALDGLQNLGANVLAETRSPFGPVLTIQPPNTALAAIAGLPAVQEVEPAHARRLANDLSRVSDGISIDTLTTTNYLGLSGMNILVAVDDSGIDATHPDLAGRVMADSPASALDLDGHGTHVAGIIASSGGQSSTVTNAQGSINPGTNGQYRGKAPAATLFSMNLNRSDLYLQETAARTNALISNNSWTYGVPDYDLAAASYDAAVRDSVPELPGSQSLIYVFPSGNEGAANTQDLGNDDGSGGNPDTIESPGTAKNVITVGAIEQMRNITNETVLCDPAFGGCATNQPWLPSTDSSNQVAGFSGRGNVGIGIEGDFGRFKPDVVAPGTFVVSTRSSQWDEAAYYNPTNYSTNMPPQFLTMQAFSSYTSGLFVPINTVQLIVSATAITPQVNLPLTLTGGAGILSGVNQIAVPPDGALNPLDTFWQFTITNPNPQAVTFNWQTVLAVTNSQGNFLQVLQQMNDSLGGFYRYESGTSLAAADVSGMLALMQEFFAVRLGVTNSPALMKAMLINGARSVSSSYDFQVQNAINYQGWGQVFLPTTLPGGLSNLVATPSASSSMFVFDQSPTNALATGQSHTRFFSLSPDGQAQPFRVTLAWTDPPGNPAAGIKLVNDLDLVVTNLDTGDVFFGNDIQSGNQFNLPWITNQPPNIDVVNNVENVYLNQPLGTNYSVTVVGSHVNVNAVTANPNDVVQDYALVVSSGDGVVSNALTLVTDPGKTATFDVPTVLFITNQFPQDSQNPVSGGLLLHQHVGANTPLLGTNTIPIANDGNAVLTVGMTNQWHFYVISNDFNYTNVSFVTFMPPNLAVPRMGVTNVENQANATRPEADIDLYVTTDPGLTNLSLVAVANAYKSLGPGGTEVIVLSNAAPQSVYYAGIKSEDQQAAEYSFLAVFSLLPPSSTDSQGNVLMRGIPVPAIIPPGIPPHPQAATVLGINVQQIQVRRVVVTNTFTHNMPGNLIGTLSHNSTFDVLNNHTCAEDNLGNCITNTYNYIYEDNGQGDVFGSRPSDGPGNLRDFIGQQGIGVWQLTMVNAFPSGTGEVDRLDIKLEPQDLNTNGIAVDLLPNSWFYDAIDVPGDATNLTVCVSGNTFPLDLYVSRAGPPTQSSFDHFLLVIPPGGCLPVTIYDNPPLVAGRYYIGVYNPNFAVQHIRVSAQIFSNPFAIATSIAGAGGPISIQDNAITYSYLTNLTHLPISALDVGMLISDPRISDLAITLISPTGTRVLLFENRGAYSTNGLGTFSSEPSSTYMAAFYTNNFDDVLAGAYAPGAVFDGWHVLQDQVSIYPELPAPWLSNNVALLNDGIISNNLPTTNSTSYSLSFEVSHAPYIVGTVGWWPFDGDGSDIFGGFNGLLFGDVLFSPRGEVNQAFFGDGLATRMVVPAAPQLDVGQGNGFTIEGWINPRSVAAPGPLLEWNNPNIGNGQGVQVWLDAPFSPKGAAGALSAVLWDNASQPHAIDTPAGSVTNGGWQHFALTFDRATFTARVYLNGALSTVQAVSTTNFIPRTSGDLYFGYHPGASPNFAAYAGGLDEFGLYNRVLSDCEIAAIFNAGSVGKSDPLVLSCPVVGTVQVLTSLGPVTSIFKNTPAPGLSGAITGLTQTITIPFTTLSPGAGTTPITITSLDPSLAVDNFVLSGLATNYLNGLMHFTENTNLAAIPIKFAPAPYTVSNIPPTIIFSNDFENAAAGLYSTNATLPGTANSPIVGARAWTVINSPVTVLANPVVAAGGTNCIALGSGGLQCALPTTAGNRYELTYSVRGPGMVSWWNGDTDPLSHRAWDILGGNDGAYINGATNSPAGFVNVLHSDTQTLYFPGLVDPVNDLASKIDLGDPANLQFTNSFTIEAWVMPAPVQNFVPEQTEELFYRGDSRQCSQPYFLGLERVSASQMDVVFHVQDNTTGDCGVILESAAQPVQVGQWQHIAAVFEAHVPWEPNAPWPTNELRLYVNGQQLTTQSNAVFLENPPGIISSLSGYTGEFPFGNLDPAYSPGVSIGNRSRADNSEPFTGYIDHLSVYGRALTGPEIAAIAAAGSNGKADFSLPPSLSLAKVAVLLNDIQVDAGYGDNSQWTTHTVDFTADSTNVVLTLQSLLPGTLVDGISLTELPAELNYLPETSLAALNGQDAYGVWTLEMQDTRVGANTAPNSASLLNWQLNFVLQPSNAPPVIHLQHGVVYTNTLVAGGIENFVVDFPQWATNATNVLVSAVDRNLGTPLPVGVLWDPYNQAPLAPTKAIVWPPNNSGSKVLSSTATPADIVPGQPYYLTITNPNPTSVTFAYGVWFDIPALTNCVTSPSYVAQAGIPRYFQFSVPADAAPPGAFPQAVSFYLTGVPGVPVGVRSNVTVVLSQHLPLPDLSHYDYISSQPDTNDDILMVITNTTPFPLQTNIWYVGVFNQADTSVPFAVQACVSSAYPTIVPLTNDVPFVAGLTNAFAAPPGPPRQFFFEFQVTNQVDAFMVEMYNLSGDADLVMQKDTPPTMAPYYAGSFQPGTNWEQIVVRATPQVPSLMGNWYIGVYNNETNDVAYALRAIVSSNGLLDSIQEPPTPTVTALSGSQGVLLSWYSVVGEYYQVQSTAPGTANWQPVPGGLLRATTPLTTFVIAGSAGTLDIYRIIHISSLNPPLAPLQIQFWTNNQVRISWSSAVVGGILQYADTPFGPWFNANLPVTLVGAQYVVFDNIGVIPRYYRLLQ